MVQETISTSTLLDVFLVCTVQSLWHPIIAIHHRRLILLLTISTETIRSGIYMPYYILIKMYGNNFKFIFLNRQLFFFKADSATIQQAYRRLSLLYHPDKHLDARNKQLAMDLFIQVKRAYDILNDAQKRAIYDVLGMKGLNTEGWEVRSY